jgi:hypothetical protein
MGGRILQKVPFGISLYVLWKKPLLDDLASVNVEPC